MVTRTCHDKVYLVRVCVMRVEMGAVSSERKLQNPTIFRKLWMHLCMHGATRRHEEHQCLRVSGPGPHTCRVGHRARRHRPPAHQRGAGLRAHLLHAQGDQPHPVLHHLVGIQACGASSRPRTSPLFLVKSLLASFAVQPDQRFLCSSSRSRSRARFHAMV